MAPSLRALWHDPVPREERRGRRAVVRLSRSSTARSAEAISLVQRRMRSPLIVVFAVSTLGLTLIPGQDADDAPVRMSFFDAFYVIIYAATTIGFGEIPYAFSYGQLRWVTLSIYLSVIGWACAIGSLFTVMELDALLVPAEVIAHEVYAQLSTPLLWRFLRDLPSRDDAWAAEVLDRLVALCGTRLQTLWKVRLTPAAAPAVQGRLSTGEARLGDVLRNPEDREVALHAVPLLVLRGDEATAAPDGDFLLAPGGERLLAGWTAAERALTTMLEVGAVHGYVLTGRRVPANWIRWKLSPTVRSRLRPARPGAAR